MQNLQSKYAELEKKLGGALRETDMIDTDYKDPKHPVYWLEFYGAHCPICGGTHWCMINVTGTKVVCQRQANNHPFQATGGYMYYLDKNFKVSFDVSKQKPLITHPKAKPEILDMFYRAVMLCYPLCDRHRENLHKRGMTDEMINLRGKRAFGTYYPTKKDKDGNVVDYFSQAKIEPSRNGRPVKIISLWNGMLDNLKTETGNPKFTHDYWLGVPGFYNVEYPYNGKTYQIPKFAPKVFGMLVPFYNEYNQIIGMQSRVDHVKEKAEIINSSVLGGKLKVDFNSYTRKYKVLLYSAIGKKEATVIAEGKVPVDQNVVNLDYAGMKYAFKMQKGGKYFWVSSAKQKDGAKSQSPVSVVYNPEIASLDPTKVDPKTGKPTELDQIETYSKKPKAVWLTEGGLKAIIATDYLPMRFNQQQLDVIGRDFLAVGGVSQYSHFLPMLKKLNVTSVTTAYDMDFQENQQVKDNYRKLLKMLKQHGYKVRFANWDLSKAKGIDDALVKGIEIDFKEI